MSQYQRELINGQFFFRVGSVGLGLPVPSKTGQVFSSKPVAHHWLLPKLSSGAHSQYQMEHFSILHHLLLFCVVSYFLSFFLLLFFNEMVLFWLTLLWLTRLSYLSFCKSRYFVFFQFITVCCFFCFVILGHLSHPFIVLVLFIYYVLDKMNATLLGRCNMACM